MLKLLYCRVEDLIDDISRQNKNAICNACYSCYSVECHIIDRYQGKIIILFVTTVKDVIV